MNIIDVSIFVVYILITLFVGICVSKKGSKCSSPYFLDMKLPKLVIALCLFTIVSCAQSNNNIPKSYIAYKTSETITIDGEPTETSWNKTEWSDAFIDIEGVKTPTYDTQVKMMWDENYYYILAKIEEPHVWADITERDAIIFHNNDFEVFIDPDSDTFNYYEIEVNALNTVWDLFITKPYREKNAALNDWTLTGLKSAVKVDGTLNNPTDKDKGWTLELAIPWKAFKTSYFEKNVPENKHWRVNFSRVNWDFQLEDVTYQRKKDAEGKFLHEYNWVWSQQGVINMHVPEKWGYVYFSSKEVGSKDTFTIPQDDSVKEQLYTLYKAQNNYRKKYKKWATSIDSLTSKAMVVNHKTLQPTLENHTTGYNISVKSPFTNTTLIITEIGKIISN